VEQSRHLESDDMLYLVETRCLQHANRVPMEVEEAEACRVRNDNSAFGKCEEERVTMRLKVALGAILLSIMEVLERLVLSLPHVARPIP
jgi:hypothetical protein